MKIAFLGTNSLSLEGALYFRNQGAEIKIFCDGNEVLCRDKELSENEIVAGKILRVQKRFLDKDEQIPHRSRMADLFRVIWEYQPQEHSLPDPELQQKIQSYGQKFWEHLQAPLEMAADFDAVVETRTFPAKPMGAAGTWALGEKNPYLKSQIFYEQDVWLHKNEWMKDLNTIGIVGNMPEEMELWLENWLDSSHKVIHIHKDPTKLRRSLADKLQLQEEKGKEIFQQNILKWKELEDYEKAKVPKPKEPTKLYSFYEGYSVTGVDHLWDQKGIYLTCERPFFKGQEELITLAVDKILVFCGYESFHDYSRYLSPNEPGWYCLSKEKHSWDFIYHDLLKYFSKRSM